jgi:proliferating cell nuclear antigen PCNA
MKLRIDGTLFKNCISVISNLVEEVQFTAGLEEVRILEMDPANVAMVSLKLPKSSCVEYDVPAEEKIGIKLSNLTAILRRVVKDDFVLLETINNQLIVKIGYNRTFWLPLIAIEDHKDQKWPALELPAKVKMDTKILNSSMEDVDIIAESASFELTPETLIINGEGDLAIAKIEMKNSDSTRISGTFEKVKAKYSLEYLKKMIDPKVAKDVTLEFKTDYPIRMSYVTDQFSLSYVLAPRVDND